VKGRRRNRSESDSGSADAPQLPQYEASSKHCEPITAQKPGSKCPAWSAPMAQALLNGSEEMGQKRVATAQGIAFVAQRT
jgi:hypothetical protein